MKSMYWLGGLFVALGILSGVIGVVSYRNGQKQLAGYVQATATVSDWVPDPNYGTPDYCPKYEYTTQDGSTRSYIGSDCEAKPDPQTVGHQQEVIFYDPTNPYTDVATRGWTGSEGSRPRMYAEGKAISTFWPSLTTVTWSPTTSPAPFTLIGNSGVRTR